MVGKIARLPLQYEPGEKWTYGLSYDVLGAVIERVSGRTLAEFFEEEIFDPLRMDNTGFHVLDNPWNQVRLAKLFQQDGKQPLEQVQPGIHLKDDAVRYSSTYPFEQNAEYFSGGAGLTSTAKDFLRFLQMFLQKEEFEGPKILSAESLEAMTTNQIGDLINQFPKRGHGAKCGFSFYLADSKRDSGAPAGVLSGSGFFDTYFWIDPGNDLICLLMTQTVTNDESHQLWDGLQRIVYSEPNH